MNGPISIDGGNGAEPALAVIEPIAASAHPHAILIPEQIGEAFAALTGAVLSIHHAANTNPVQARVVSADIEVSQFTIEVNEAALPLEGRSTFVAWLGDAKFQFALNDPTWNALPGKDNQFSTQFPDRCLILNRRAAPRLGAPLGGYQSAAFFLRGKYCELLLHDLALGGIGLRCLPVEAKGFFVGRKLLRVRLELGQDSVMICDLEVRMVRRFRSFLLGEQMHIGCRFINPSQQVLDEVQRALERGPAPHVRGAG